MSPDKVVCSRHSCRLSIAQGTIDVPIRLFRQNLMLAPRCSRALLHNLQPASDRGLILAIHLATKMIPVIVIIPRFLYLQGTHRASECFPKNHLLSLYRNVKSAVHVPSWCRVINIVLFCPSSHTRPSSIFCHQSNCSTARPLPCYGVMPPIVACTCSPLCHHHLYTILHIVDWVCWFVSKHL